MMRAISVCKFMQTSPEKIEMKNIPGAFRSDKRRKSNHSADAMRCKCFDRRGLAAVSGSVSIQRDAGRSTGLS
jgi:hypothetical protein